MTADQESDRMRNISVAYDKISVFYYSILQDIFLGRSEAALYVTIRLERFNPWQFLRCFVVTYIAYLLYYL